MTRFSNSTQLSEHASAVLRSRFSDGVLDLGALMAEWVAALELGVSRVPVRKAFFTVEFAAQGTRTVAWTAAYQSLEGVAAPCR